MSQPRQSRPPRRFDERWRLSRAGIVNVWFYLDNEFNLSGGRMILRGTNGSGKSRALEMLLPFLLDADRRRMDATGAARVSLDELMRTGAQGQSNRTGYLWLELARPGEYLTVGALVRNSQSASSTKVWYFTTSLRVGEGLSLMSATREPLSRDALTELIGADRITESAHTHREHIRTLVFGLPGDAGRDRYDGLLQLLHTLRAPDVGNRIDEGRLPQILLESLPPLQEEALSRAGEQLDGLTETRLAQRRLEYSYELLKLGAVDSRDVVESQQSLLSAQDSYERALSSLQIAVLRYLRSTGTLRVDPTAGSLGVAMDRAANKGKAKGDEPPAVPVQQPKNVPPVNTQAVNF